MLALYSRAILALARWLTMRRIRLYVPVLISTALGSYVLALAFSLSTRLVVIPVIDFANFYLGGHYLLAGQVEALYDPSAQKAFFEQLFGQPLPASMIIPRFVHPPFSVLVYAPFALGGYYAGLLSWWAFSFLALGLAVYLLDRHSGLPHPTAQGRRIFRASLLFGPTLICFLYGQSSALTLLLFCAAFVLLRREQNFLAGLTWGLALYKPQLLLAPALLLLVQRRWSSLGGMLLSAGAWILVGFAISPQAMVHYANYGPTLPTAVRTGEFPLWAMHTLYGFAVLLLDGTWPAGGTLLGLGLTAAGLIAIGRWWWSEPWQPGTRRWDLTMAATLALGLLVSPYILTSDLMLLLLPLILVWAHYARGTAGQALDSGPLLAWTGLLWVAALASASLTQFQLGIATTLGLPAVATQLSVPVVLGWALETRRAALGLAQRAWHLGGSEKRAVLAGPEALP